MLQFGASIWQDNDLRPARPVLDFVDNVYGAYAFERLLSSYPLSSALVRLRRGSDNVEADFVPDSGGFVTVAAIRAWAGEGVSVFVDTFYDQSGNSRHWAQSSNSLQPQVLMIGKPKAIFASASSKRMTMAAAGLDFARNIGAVTVLVARKFSTYAANQDLLTFSNNSTAARLSLGYTHATSIFRAGGRRLDADSFATTTGTAKDRAWAVQIGRFDFTNSDLYHQCGPAAEVNSSFQTDGSTSDTASASAVLGAQPNAGGSYFDGLVSAVVLLRDLLTDNEVLSLRQMMLSTTSANPAYLPGGGTIIARSATPSSSFIGSASIVRESSTGHLFALHDFFISTDVGSTGGALYKSTDEGLSWSQVATFATLEWCTIWEHTDGNLYIFGLTTAFGNVQIGKSIDHGVTWNFTTLSTTGGPLTVAGSGTTAPNYHRGSGLPPCYLDGYLFFGLENFSTWSATDYSSMRVIVLSVSASADLTDRTQWSASTQFQIGAHSFGANTGMIETNVVSDQTGALYAVTRLIKMTATTDKAAFIPLTRSGGTITMPVWDSAFIKDFPGGHIKFQLVRSGDYFYSLTNKNTAVARSVGASNDADQRNRVDLVRGSAADLSAPDFTSLRNIIHEDDVAAYAEVALATSVADHGIQYASFIIEDGYALPVYRVAWDGAGSYGFSNMMTFGSPVSLT